MNKKIFGRAAALGLAGLTVLPAYSMIASAEAYPTYVYEFTYGGIEATQMYWKNVVSTQDNAYINFASQAAAQAVFTSGFTATGLDSFWDTVDDAIVANGGIAYASVNKVTGGWTYKMASQFTDATSIVLPEESYNERVGHSLGYTFAFKSKSERDAAMSDIASKNKSEYSSKYSAANSALSKDLSSAVSSYQTAQKSIISKAQNEVNTYFKNNPTETSYTITTTDVSTLDSITTTVYKSSSVKPSTSDLTLSEWVSKQNAFVTAEVKELNTVVTQLKKEFTEAYQPANFAFSYDSASDGFANTDEAIPFVSNYGAVTTTSVGTYISAATDYTLTTGTGTLAMDKDYYRTVGAYVNPDSYAFKGEIILAADRRSADSADINSLLLDSDCWSLFSVLLEGKPTDNNNTTENNTTTDDKKEEETTKTPDQTAVYKVGSYYYPTYSAAFNAANGNEDIITKIRDYAVLPYDYFSQVTGSFYSKYADALKASNNEASKVTVFNNASTSTGNENSLDPYYYYWLAKQQGGTTVKDTTSATLGKRTGWTSIANYLSGVSNGTSATVDMNKETTVPSSVLGAIEGKNVTVKFVQDNGASLTVNGKDVANAKNVEIDVTYNTKSISKKLIQNAFKKNGAVSSAQISIDEGSFGFESDLTVKFNSKRAGYSAKIYRYNSSRNSLQLVDTATVSNSGKTTFDSITKGGEFVIVLFED